MGILVVKCYPTTLFAKAADHTYVECGTGAVGWKCWGGKTGGTQLRQGAGSTIRANDIAEPDEKAGITCYLINGVCHQAANRILLPAQITVNGARGYGVSHALFGVYGRVGTWPCSSPFNQHTGVTGDLSACAPPSAGGDKSLTASVHDQFDWNYVREELSLYAAQARLFAPPVSESQRAPGSFVAARAEIEEFHMSLFAHMLDAYVGPMLDSVLRSELLKVRRQVEQRRMDAEQEYAKGDRSGKDFVAELNQLTLDFQDQMAEQMSDVQYQTLFRLKRDERVVLADPAITSDVFGV